MVGPPRATDAHLGRGTAAACPAVMIQRPSRFAATRSVLPRSGVTPLSSVRVISHLNITIAFSESIARTATSVARSIVVRAQPACSFASTRSTAKRPLCLSPPTVTQSASSAYSRPNARTSWVFQASTNASASAPAADVWPAAAPTAQPKTITNATRCLRIKRLLAFSRSAGGPRTRRSDQPLRLRSVTKHSESGTSARSRVF
jgi:hypothetical protein